MGQQDSHELMRRLLDGLREEVLKKDERGKALPKQVTYVDDVFGGNLVSVIVCHSCKNVSYVPIHVTHVNWPSHVTLSDIVFV